MQLILYHFEQCPYCQDVRQCIDRLGISNIEYRDVRVHPPYAQELLDLHGTRQVPCLLVDGKPMLESQDIMAFLEKHFPRTES